MNVTSNGTMIHAVSTFFEGIDERNWTKMRLALAEDVVLDSSRVGRSEHQLTADQLVSMSRTATGGFQSTCHHFGNCLLYQTDTRGEAEFDMVTLHYLPLPSGGDVWTLFRKINTRLLLNEDGRWVITHIQTNFEQAAGNLEIPVLAQKGGREHPSAVPGINEHVIKHFFTAITEQHEENFQSLWADEGQWRIYCSSPDNDREITGMDSIMAHFRRLSAVYTLRFIFSRHCIDTANPDISIMPYETIIQSADGAKSGSVSAIVFYFRDGLIRSVEEYNAG